MSRSKIIQDNSYYQQFIDFPMMKSLGQDYMIVKCMSGNGRIDTMWESHYKNGTDADINMIPYLWLDPLDNPIEQAKAFLKEVEKKNVLFMVIDFEQWWADWTLWLKNKKDESVIVPVIPPDVLFNHFKTTYEYITRNTTLAIIVYVANWFVRDYLPEEAYAYLESIYTWWADYTLFNKTKVTKTWEELEALVPETNTIPTLPRFYNTDRVLLWQFSGDKFKAKGIYGDKNKTRLSELDLNKWVNPNITIEQISGIPAVVIPPVEVKPVIETFKKSTKFVNVLNVPYVSQLGAGATKHNNDCGAACACSIIGGYKDIVPTVDEFYDKAQANGDVYLSATQMINTLKKYDVYSTWYISDMKSLMTTLSSGKPVICLILYKTLVDAKIVQSTFKGYHFVLAIGYDTKNIYINDPLAGGEYLEVPIDVFNQCWKDAGIKPADNPAYGCIVPNIPIGEIVAGYDKYVVTSTSGLRVRKEPIVQNNPSNVIRTMNYNEEFRVISISNNWGNLVGGGYSSMTYARKI